MKAALLVLGLIPVQARAAAALTATEIVDRANKVMRGDSSSGAFTMTIRTKEWTRELKAEGWNEGREKALIRIHAPAKDKGTGTLKLGREMWLWLPRVEKVIKIPPSMMHNAWMGSDFTNEDIVKADAIVKDYTHRVLSVKHEKDWDLYEIEALPLPDAPVVWGKVLLWGRVYPDNQTVIPVRQEHYSERGELIRTIELGDVQTVEGRLVPLRLVCVNNKKEGQRTTLQYSSVHFDVSYPADFFSLARLQRFR